MSGYKLLKDESGNYKLVSSNGTFKGNANQVINHAVLELGFDKSEIELGMEEMTKRFHNAAEYGMFKSFMWSYDRGVSNETFATVH